MELKNEVGANVQGRTFKFVRSNDSSRAIIIATSVRNWDTQAFPFFTAPVHQLMKDEDFNDGFVCFNVDNPDKLFYLEKSHVEGYYKPLSIELQSSSGPEFNKYIKMINDRFYPDSLVVTSKVNNVLSVEITKLYIHVESRAIVTAISLKDAIFKHQTLSGWMTDYGDLVIPPEYKGRNVGFYRTGFKVYNVDNPPHAFFVSGEHFHRGFIPYEKSKAEYPMTPDECIPVADLSEKQREAAAPWGEDPRRNGPVITPDMKIEGIPCTGTDYDVDKKTFNPAADLRDYAGKKEPARADKPLRPNCKDGKCRSPLSSFSDKSVAPPPPPILKEHLDEEIEKETIEIFGDSNKWQIMGTLKTQSWAKRRMAYEIEGVGCIVLMSCFQRVYNNKGVATTWVTTTETSVFVPDTMVITQFNSKNELMGRRLGKYEADGKRIETVESFTEPVVKKDEIW